MDAETPKPQKIDILAGLHEIAERRDIPRQLADLVYGALPDGVRNFDVTRDSTSGQLFYDLPGVLQAGGIVAWGNEQNTRSLDRLFDCVMACALRLDRRSSESVFRQLGNASKHLDFMREIDIVLNIPDGVRLDHEVRVVSGSQKSVDWQITPRKGPIVLLDVKARLVDLVAHFAAIGPQLRADAKEIANAAPTDATPLFRSLEEKFPSRPPELFLQGAWINVNIKHPEKVLVNAFNALDGSKVHFALIVSSGRNAYVLKRDGVRVDHLRAVLRFEESRDAIAEST